MQVSAQSWPGLTPRDDERYRIAAAAGGGIWLLRTPHPDHATGLAGHRRSADTARRVAGAALWGQDGSSRLRDEPVADPAIIRSLDTGQAAHIYRGGVTFVQVKRLVAAPAALGRDSPAAAGPSGPPGVERRSAAGTLRGDTADAHQRPTLPDAGPLLDEAFGPGQG